MGRAEAQRSQPDALQPFPERPVKPERKGFLRLAPAREQEREPILADPPGRKRQRLCALRIDPVEVVYGDRERALSGQGANGVEEGDHDGRPVDTRSLRLLEQKSYLEGLPLRARELGKGLVDGVREQI